MTEIFEGDMYQIDCHQLYSGIVLGSCVVTFPYQGEKKIPDITLLSHLKVM